MAKGNQIKTLLGYLEKEESYPKALAYVKKHPKTFYAALKWMTEEAIPLFGNFAVSLTKENSHIEEPIYRRILELKPADSTAHINLGNLLSDKEEADEAEAEYRAAINADPNNSAAHNNLGILLKNKGKLKEAEAEYRATINADPNNSGAHNNFAILLEEQGKLNEAVKEYRKSMECDPSNPYPHYNYGGLLEKQDEYEEALEKFQEAERLLDPKEEPDKLDYLKTRIALVGKRLEAKISKEKPPKEVEIQDIVLKVFDRMGPEKERHKLIETILGNQRDLESVLAKPPRRAKRKDKTLYILRRFNSYTPLLAYSGSTSRGGGYFLEWNDYGIVIDPGFNFVQNFLEVTNLDGSRRFSLPDIDAIVITHAHNDHTGDFEALLTLIYEYNKKNTDKISIDVYLSPSAMKKLIELFRLERETINNIYTLNPGGASLEVTKGLKLKPIPAKHDDIISEEYCIGLVFEGADRRLVFSSDTEWSDKLIKPAYEKHRKCDYFIAHLGTVTEKEMSYSGGKAKEQIFCKNHLGLVGVIKAIEALKPKYVILSEFGEELKGHRARISKILQDGLQEHTKRVIPGDLALRIQIDNEKAYCPGCAKFQEIKTILYFEKPGKDEIEYFCEKCKG